MNLDQIRLDDKWERVDDEPYLPGTQALVKVTMLRGIRDRQAEMLHKGHDPLPRAEVV